MQLLQCTKLFAKRLPAALVEELYNLEKRLGTVDDVPTNDQAQISWVRGMRDMCKLANVHWATGSDEECVELCELMVKGASQPGGSGQCNSCNGWSECSAGPVGMYYWAHRPGGMGSPTQGAVGASFRAYGGPSSSENRAHRPGGDGESRPLGGRSLLQGPWGGVIC